MEDLDALRQLLKEQITPEVLHDIFISKRDVAVDNFLRATWRGINSIDPKQAEIICKETCRCFESWMPPGFEEIIKSFYDKDNPDVDKALTMHVIIEKVAATPSGADATITRKGNIARLVTAQNGCICPFVAIYKAIDPTPNICTCPQNLFENYFKEYYNIPIKCTVIKSRNRGDDCCVYEMEFPDELIKTPEYEC